MRAKPLRVRIVEGGSRVDEETRGGAELLAAVLRGEGGILVGGNRTPGDAGVREALALGDGQRVYIATRWLVPTCGSYARTGIEPDVVLAAKAGDGEERLDAAMLLEDYHLSEGEKRAADMAARVVGDTVLRRATDIVLGMSALYSSDEERGDWRRNVR